MGGREPFIMFLRWADRAAMHPPPVSQASGSQPVKYQHVSLRLPRGPNLRPSSARRDEALCATTMAMAITTVPRCRAFGWGAGGGRLAGQDWTGGWPGSSGLSQLVGEKIRSRKEMIT